MTRPRIYNELRVCTAVRLPATLHERVRMEAARRQVSANLLIERAIADYLSQLPQLDEQLPVRR